jgi:N-acetylmuramoyl-L-alanine amidase
MRYIAILDDGHGDNTAGKWSPKFADGTRFRENSFNKPVAAQIGRILTALGVEVFYTAPEDADVSLDTRCARAARCYNDALTQYGKGNFAAALVSVHANAAGAGEVWMDAHGIETFRHPADPGSGPLAEAVQKALVTATGLYDRGVKTYNFQILREVPAALPAVLCECGFFDNKREVELLMSAGYQKSCAEAIAKGICAFLGVRFTVGNDETIPTNDAALQKELDHTKQLLAEAEADCKTLGDRVKAYKAQKTCLETRNRLLSGLLADFQARLGRINEISMMGEQYDG